MHQFTPIRRRRLLAALSIAGLSLAGCSERNDAGTDDSTNTAATTTVGNTGGTDAATGADSGSGGGATASDGDTGRAGSESDGAEASAPDLFDDTVVHRIELTYDQDDYEAMIATLADTGDKEWIEATVTVDGVTYEHAGIRLKGNSSLAGLSGGGPGGLAAPPGGGAQAGEAPPTDGQNGGFGGFPGGGVSADEPEGLPWLIRLDEFVDGQSHQGYVDIVVRSNNSQTSINEAVALDLLAEAGLASQRAASVSLAVNGGDPTLRLMIEHPDDDAWQDANFESDGALYKAESTGDWSYRGDDPASYEEVFDQEGGSKVAGLTPLIEFLQFINESDDATFAAELPERLDVEAFATYLAMMDIVQNFDDIRGPGNNAYLWWDAETEQFTVVPWDMNLAFGGGAFPGGSIPGGGFPGGSIPEGLEPPEGFEPPDVGGFGGFGRSNPLVERFHSSAEFEALYQERLVQLRADLIDSGVAAQLVASWAEVLTEQAVDLVDAPTIEQEADAITSSLSAA